jgi:DNA-binding Lrp family transcriptional regulator
MANFCHFADAYCHHVNMDATDQQLLSLLRQDAGTSVATLASKPGVSRGTVSNRITKLEDTGVIVGYTAHLSELSQVLERIRLIRGISSTETSIHLETCRLP